MRVNYVRYQPGKSDQFAHHYVYDADNRLQFIETSGDNLLWERDANYEYYLHGPLARTELGERRVQGLDYAYTLQGWLKGVNASTLPQINSMNNSLTLEKDMGRDGSVSGQVFHPHTRSVARDVFGFTLGYFAGDYRRIAQTSIGANGTNPHFEPQYIGSKFGDGSPGLFNGNIRHAAYSIKTGLGTNANDLDGFAYKYDQLNRLIYQEHHNNSVQSTNPIKLRN